MQEGQKIPSSQQQIQSEYLQSELIRKELESSKKNQKIKRGIPPIKKQYNTKKVSQQSKGLFDRLIKFKFNLAHDNHNKVLPSPAKNQIQNIIYNKPLQNYNQFSDYYHAVSHSQRFKVIKNSEEQIFKNNNVPRQRANSDYQNYQKLISHQIKNYQIQRSSQASPQHNFNSKQDNMEDKQYFNYKKSQ